MIGYYAEKLFSSPKNKDIHIAHMLFLVTCVGGTDTETAIALQAIDSLGGIFEDDDLNKRI